MTMTHRVGTWAVGAVLAVTALTSAVNAQEVPAASPTASTQAPAGGMSEGIKVHGHWTIEVRNPDGSVASKHEFQNDLDTLPAGRGGAFALASLLGRTASAGIWRIQLDDWGPGGIGGVSGPCSSNNPCSIIEDTIGAPTLLSFFRNLTVNVSSSAAIELSGNATMARDGLIRRVSTRLMTCPNTTTPLACRSDWTLSDNIFSFTMRVLSSPISVTAGQIVQVSVVLSFS